MHLPPARRGIDINSSLVTQGLLTSWQRLSTMRSVLLINISPYDIAFVLGSDCTFGQTFQPNPGEPVCSDIYNCRRSWSIFSLTVNSPICISIELFDYSLAQFLIAISYVNLSITSYYKLALIIVYDSFVIGEVDT